MTAIGRFLRRLVGIGASKPEESLVGTVITRLIPDRAKAKEIMVEVEKEIKLHEVEMEKYLAEDIQNARQMYIVELMQLKGKFLNFIRGFVRPYLSYIAGSIWAYTIVDKIITKSRPLLSPLDYSIIGAVIAFWFGSRFLERGKILKGG